MSAAINAKSAKARATIAARLIKTTKPWPQGYGLGRNFDDCFEMNDGGEVLAILKEKAKTDRELLYAMMYTHRNYCESWANDVANELGIKGSDVFYMQ